jgi:ribosomal protein L37AE/L43A
MKCPNCGNQKFERLDYSVVRCTECYSLFDPYIYPGFPEPEGEVGQEWDTTESDSDDWEADV